MASPRQPRRLSQAEQMETSLRIRRVEFLEARAEALDTLKGFPPVLHSSPIVRWRWNAYKRSAIAYSLPIITLCIAYSLADPLGLLVSRFSRREPYTSRPASIFSSEPYNAACRVFNGKADEKTHSLASPLCSRCIAAPTHAIGQASSHSSPGYTSGTSSDSPGYSWFALADSTEARRGLLRLWTAYAHHPTVTRQQLLVRPRLQFRPLRLPPSPDLPKRLIFDFFHAKMQQWRAPASPLQSLAQILIFPSAILFPSL